VVKKIIKNNLSKSNNNYNDEWAEWFRMTPAQRWKESIKLWSFYLEVGGSLDPEPDTQSPFYTAFTSRPVSLNGRPGMRVLRRSRV